MKKVKDRFFWMNVLFASTLVLVGVSRVVKNYYPESLLYYAVMSLVVLNVLAGMVQILRFWIASGYAKDYVEAFQAYPPSNAEGRLAQHHPVLNTLKWLANEFLIACHNEQRLRGELSPEEAGKENRQSLELLVAIHHAEVKVRTTKTSFRKAQRAANFFEYNTPKRAKAFANCNSLL